MEPSRQRGTCRARVENNGQGGHRLFGHNEWQFKTTMHGALCTALAVYAHLWRGHPAAVAAAVRVVPEAQQLPGGMVHPCRAVLNVALWKKQVELISS